MTERLRSAVLAGMVAGGSPLGTLVAEAEPSLLVVYPPDHHQTVAEQIFLIGTAPPDGEVTVNGTPIDRSPAGHFAPSFPLQLGVNLFTIRYQDREIQLEVTRLPDRPEIPPGAAFAPDSLTPDRDIARLPGELICFGAIAPPQAAVSVELAGQAIPLFPQLPPAQLPENSAVLIDRNQPRLSGVSSYQGCGTFSQPGQLGTPLFEFSLGRRRIAQPGTGTVEILSPSRLSAIEVVAESGITRTGPSSDYSRLTPLPRGSRAVVTGKEGDWWRLDYGAWIQQKETELLSGNTPITSIVRSINYRQVEGATEIYFPLQVPVPIAIQQGEKSLTLTLYNTTAQTDTIRLDGDPVIKWLAWQQVSPSQINYTFHLKSEQQWGYEARYEGSTLILSLRYPPKLDLQNRKPLTGITLLLDPGHGGQETGAKGPNGYPEKAANLAIAQLLKKALVERGATVYLTRETDRDLSLPERVAQIDRLKPTLALSLHYNALPDGGDAIKTAGISTFWYHPQARSLAVFLHDYLIQKLQRPSAGIFWNNLALTRPHTAPSVLLELGFTINPYEFEWIVNPQEREKLAGALAEGIVEWFRSLE